MQINIGFGINNSYVKYTGCAMASILANAKEEDSYKFFIACDYISDENKTKLESLKYIKDFDIEYVQANPDNFKHLFCIGFIDISVFYRLHLFSLESVDKILYLDSDITVRTDIAELYSTDIEDYSLAAVEDIFAETFKKNFHLSESATYINSGVMLLNLKKLREIDIMDELRHLPDFFDNAVFGDQDVINHLFQNKILILDARWNAAKNVFYEELGREDAPSIIHYITSEKPWKLNSIAYSKEEYFKYLKLTPWHEDIMPISKSEVIVKENICDIFEIQCSQENAEKYKHIIEEVKAVIVKMLNPI